MNIKSIILWILVIIWMVVIFSFSGDIAEESSSKSEKIVYDVVNVIEKKKSNQEKEKIVEKIHIPFRKFAHGFEYCILCILLLLALNNSNISNNKIYIIAFIICIIYSISDEIHQLFISGRSGEIRDVLIDTAGATIGLMIYILIEKRIKKKKS